MSIIWYVSVCAVFFGVAYAFSKREENKRLRAQLSATLQEAEFPRRFVNLSA